jgi:hypothetical protein
MKETTWKTYAQKIVVHKMVLSSPTSSVCAEYLTKSICHEQGYEEFLTAFVIAVVQAPPSIHITATRMNYGMCYMDCVK